MKKLVLFDTALGSGNLGDEIIYEAVRESMRDVTDPCFTLRLATHVPNFSVLQLLRPNQKIRFFQDADLKLICGTNLLAQERVARPRSQWALYPSNLSLYRNSVLVGVGTTGSGGTLSPAAKWLYRKILSDRYAHSVRDELTREIVESLGLKAYNTGCPTLWDLTPEACERIPRRKAGSCIVSVSGFDAQADREKDAGMLEIVSRNYKKVWAWIQTVRDEEYLASLPGSERFPRLCSLSRFREVLLQGDADYVGTRLHGGIFALRHGCRAIVISIDHRAEGMHQANNLPVVKRDAVETELEERIHGTWATEIVINGPEIQAFKDQFR